MKKHMFNTIMLSIVVALTSCGGDVYENNAPVTVGSTEITVEKEMLNIPSYGGNYSIKVSTTGAEWGAYTTADFFSITTENSKSQSGTLSISIPANPDVVARKGNIIIMSGTTRKTINVEQAASSESAYNAPEGYHIVWGDEFDIGSELNGDNWTHEVKNSGWVNNELQNYVNHKSPEGKLVTEIKNGHLQIHCFKENGKIYSGRVYAKVREGWTYGYIEASIKLPKGKGTWPAFWMMPVNFKSWPADGEIDIMEEVGYNPNYVSSSLHANSHVHTKGTQVTHEMKCEGAEDDFHVYAIEWTSKNITTYVDGKVQLSYDNRGLGRDDWPYDAPFYIIFNLAWGGDWGGAQGVDESALPATMEVDYVRVFQK